MDARPVDINLLCETHKYVDEVEEVVGEWAFHIDRCPVTLKIKVVKTTRPPDMYIGFPITRSNPQDKAAPIPGHRRVQGIRLQHPLGLGEGDRA